MIRIAGSPRDRGVTYGELAREQIEASLSFYSGTVAPALGGSWGALCDGAASRIDAWEAADPDLFAEMRGIAAGSRTDLVELVALNTRGSFSRHRSGRGEAAPAATEGCSSFAVLPEASREGHVVSGQNWDYLEGIAPSIVLLHVVPDEGPVMLMIVEAGQPARQGANSAGISLQANGLSSRLEDPTALPSPMWRRQILREPNVVAALDALSRTPRALSTNLVLTHRDGFAVDVETRPDTARWIYPEDGWLVHSNHYVAEIPPEIASTYSPAADTFVRYGRMQRLMQSAAERGIRRTDLESMLRDHFGDGRGICTHPRPEVGPERRWATVASLITNLSTGIMSVAAGPPCSHDFVDIEISTGEVVEPYRPRAVSV